MKQYKVRITKHTKYKEVLTRASTEHEAVEKAGETIRIDGEVDSESVTLTAEPVEREVDRSADNLHIPPDRRTHEGKVKEGLMCMACKKFFTNTQDMESITHTNECILCQELRTDLADQRRQDYEDLHGKDEDS
jgi:hypothetical protein